MPVTPAKIGESIFGREQHTPIAADSILARSKMNQNELMALKHTSELVAGFSAIGGV